MILFAVFIYFSLGLLGNGLVSRNLKGLVEHIPYLPRIASGLKFYGLSQGWTMFSPAPRAIYSLKYRAISPDGPQPIRDVLPSLAEEVENSFIFIPPGLIRPLTYLNQGAWKGKLDSFGMADLYFGKLKDYFCFGSGKIARLSQIQFFIQKETTSPFFNRAINGTGMPKNNQGDFLLMVYSNNCSQK